MLRETYVITGFIIDVFQGFGVMIFNILVGICAGIVLLMLSLKIIFPMIIGTHDEKKTYFSRQTCHSRSMNYRKAGLVGLVVAFVSTFHCFFFYLSLYLSMVFAYKQKINQR